MKYFWSSYCKANAILSSRNTVANRQDSPSLKLMFLVGANCKTPELQSVRHFVWRTAQGADRGEPGSGSRQDAQWCAGELTLPKQREYITMYQSTGITEKWAWRRKNVGWGRERKLCKQRITAAPNNNGLTTRWFILPNEKSTGGSQVLDGDFRIPSETQHPLSVFYHLRHMPSILKSHFQEGQKECISWLRNLSEKDTVLLMGWNLVAWPYLAAKQSKETGLLTQGIATEITLP